MEPKTKASSKFENDPLALAILREGLAIQDRFSAEPIYSKTGKGFLKSVGVDELIKIKNDARKRLETDTDVSEKSTLAEDEIKAFEEFE